MAYDASSLDDYIDVPQRIADFRELYPQGSLEPADLAMPYHVVRVPCGWCQQCIGRRKVKDGREQGTDRKWRDKWKDCPRCQGTGVRNPDEPGEDVFIVYTAAAYRTPDDPRPGIGIAWEPFPGRTPYTAGSELQNAETSAWGRAIIAVGASDAKPGIASRQEVQNRRAEREDGLPSNADGSLSRSQTTDEEKDSAGVMTSEQHAEHTQLAKGADGKLPAAERAKVERANGTAPDDPFYDPPANGGPALPEDRHGTATADQVRAVNIRLTRQGHRTKDQRMAKLTAMTGTEVHSSADLSYNQAVAVLRELDKEVAAMGGDD